MFRLPSPQMTEWKPAEEIYMNKQPINRKQHIDRNEQLEYCKTGIS